MSRRRQLRADDAAVLDIPLRLVITVVIIGLTVPPLLLFAKGYAIDQTEDRLEAEVAKVAAVAHQVAGGGAWTVEVDFSGGLMSGVDHVRFGPPEGTRMPLPLITYKVGERGERTHTPQGETNLGAPGPAFGASVVGGGVHTLHLEAAEYVTPGGDVVPYVAVTVGG